MTTLPPFISWIGHGAASLAPPAAFTGVNAHVFGFRASGTAMQRLADALLNAASDGTVHYDAMVGQALVTFMDIAQCTSTVDALGWVPGRECALWVPLLETSTRHLLPRVVFWAPYIYIDYSIGMLTGREVWGWPKVGATIGVASDSPGAPAAFTCITTVFDTMTPQTQGQSKPLFTVASDKPLAAPSSPWANGLAAGREVAMRVLAGIAGPLVDALNLQPVLPAVAMKQFRDSIHADRAAFQGIVESPARVTRFRGGGFMSANDFTLAITTCESHQIVRDFLGAAPDPGSSIVPIEWAAALAFDFAALPGATLVSAP